MEIAIAGTGDDLSLGSGFIDRSNEIAWSNRQLGSFGKKKKKQYKGIDFYKENK